MLSSSSTASIAMEFNLFLANLFLFLGLDLLLTPCFPMGFFFWHLLMRRIGGQPRFKARFQRGEKIIKPEGEYIYGLQSCRAALLANKRKFFELFIKETR